MAVTDILFLTGLGLVYAVAYRLVGNVLVLWPLLTPLGSFFANLEGGDIDLPWASLAGFGDVFALMVLGVWLAARHVRRSTVVLHRTPQKGKAHDQLRTSTIGRALESPLTALAGIWLSAALMALGAPDMVSGSQHEHLPLALITVWLWAAAATAYASMTPSRGSLARWTLGVVGSGSPPPSSRSPHRSW